VAKSFNEGGIFYKQAPLTPARRGRNSVPSPGAERVKSGVPSPRRGEGQDEGAFKLSLISTTLQAVA
jgi:hypothetical protein